MIGKAYYSAVLINFECTALLTLCKPSNFNYCHGFHKWPWCFDMKYIEHFQGLIRHIYQYFAPETLGENPSPGLVNPPVKTLDPLTKAYIPIYDEYGKTIFFDNGSNVHCL